MARLRTVLLASLLWLPFLGLVGVLLPGLVVLVLFRLFVTRGLRPCLRPDLLQPVTGLDVGFCNDAFWTAPKGAIAFVHSLSGPVQLDQIQSRLASILASPSGDYRRLTSLYPVSWLGYPFWKTLGQGSFRLAEHVRVLELDAAKRGQPDWLDSVLAEWVRSPFKTEAPLWEVLLLSCGPSSVLAFRIHHVLGDGFSMLAFLDKLFDSEPGAELEQPRSVVPGRGEDRAHWSSVLFWTPKVTLEFLMAFYCHSDVFTKKKRTQGLSLARTTMTLQDLKKARRDLTQRLQLDVSLLALMTHLLGSSLRRYLEQDLGQELLPSHVFIVVSLPIRSRAHPQNTFCNHWTHGVWRVPVREPNALSRLTQLQTQIEAQSQSQADRISHNFSELCALLPEGLRQRLISGVNMGTPFGLANLPGPTSAKHLCGRAVERKYALVGLQWEHASLALGLFSYNGLLTMTMMANEAVIPESETGRRLLSEYWQEALVELDKYSAAARTSTSPV